jgi:hypothetical protein
MSSDKLASLRQERDDLVEDYLNASTGRIELGEVRMVAIRDKINRLTKLIAELEFPYSNKT